jgi:hypothetical protein
MICLFFGGWVIKRLRMMQVSQYIRDDGIFMYGL